MDIFFSSADQITSSDQQQSESLSERKLPQIYSEVILAEL